MTLNAKLNKENDSPCRHNRNKPAQNQRAKTRKINKRQG